jgi:diguanylate cyclase (GGDEF)-like protein
LTVCLCDIDRFKRVNDTYGHSADDEVIQALSRCLAEGVRRDDLPARWGGDEFSILFPKASTSQIETCVERIRKRLESLVFTAADGRQHSVTGSFWIAELLPGMKSDDLMNAADRALYAAKQQGRNRLSFAV